MEMIINIFRDSEEVNEIKTTDEKEIYKKIAQIYHAKHIGLTSKTIITHSATELLKVVEVYSPSETVKAYYKYIYTFDGVTL